MSRPKLTLITLAAVLAACLAAAPSQAAAQVVTVAVPKSLDRAPAGYSITPRQALRVAERRPEVKRAQPGLRPKVVMPQYFRGHRYEVAYRAHGRGRVLVDVHVSGRTGRVIELWTGPQADNLLARGYSPHIGRSLNKAWIWLPLALLFLAPFFDPRRPFRLLHLDLLVLLGFGVSQLFFNRGDVQVSVPLVYPLLAYLLVRGLQIGFGRRERRPAAPLIPRAAPRWLLVGLVLLVAFRVGLNATDSHTIDVGQASVFGADRIEHGDDLYDRGNKEDTYGPLMYLAYVPFEALFPEDGPGGFEHAARAAAISFDLLTMAGLMLLGTRLRRGRDGRVLGLALAYAWAAYPFSLYALQANTNDGLIAALLVGVLLAMRSPPLRGLVLGVATAAKFAPLALAPLIGRGLGARRPRDVALFAAALAGSVALAVFAYLPDGGLRELWDSTLGYQLGRSSPFSLWGLHPSLGWAQHLVQLGAVLLAAVVFFVPRELDLRRLAALGAAVLIAVELTATHWFYFYLVWFAPLLLAALFSGHATSPAAASITSGTSARYRGRTAP